jgi:tetratricopeptide (TPR) repeat protein
MKSYVTSFGILLGLILILGSGCTIDAVRLNQQAQIYMEYGEYQKAEELLIKSLDNDHENFASRYWLGRCYQATGQMEKAIYEYNMAVRFAPSMEAAQIALVKTLYQDGQQDESIMRLKKYLEYKDALMGEFIRIARDFASDGMDIHFVVTLQCTQEKFPNDATPMLELAEFYFNKGDEEKGIEALSRALEIDPTYPGLAKRLGDYGYQVKIPEPPGFYKPSPLEEELRELDK